MRVCELSVCVNRLILDGAKVLFLLPVLRKIGCANFKRKEITIFVNDMTNVYFPKFPRTRAFC